MKNFLFCLALIVATGLDIVTPARHVAAIEPWPIDDIPHGIENRGLVCTALAVYAEARGESYFGQALVANVVVNRQAQMAYGSDACDVIEIPGQFEGIDKWPFPRQPWLQDRRAWDQALEVATVVITGDYYIPPPCAEATYFRVRGNTQALPTWGHLTYLCTVENHEFFAAPSASSSSVASLGRSPQHKDVHSIPVSN